MNRRIALGLITALLLVMTAAMLYIKLRPAPLPVIEGMGGDFVLPASNGSEFSLAAQRGKLVMLNFGFTSCPDVCPTALAKMRRTLELLAEDAEFVQPLFVTIDPQRDTLNKLRDYLHWFHPAIIGLRGNPQQLAEVAALYRAHYLREDLDSELRYGFMHNDHIYLIDQQGRVRAMHGSSSPPERIAADLYQLL